MSSEATSPRPTKGWTYPGVLIIATVTFAIVMLVDVLLNNKVTQISNVGIAVVTIIASIKVRINDRTSAIWSAPIVWFIALETVGQLAHQSGNTLARKQILHLAYGLANHSYWILGSVVLAAAITTLRRARRP